MADERNPNIDHERVQHTAEHDFRGGLKHGNVEVPNAHEQPNDSIAVSDIPDTNHIAIPVHIPADKTLYVWVWGCRTNSQTTPAGLTVELYDETGGVSVLSENTARTTGSPVTSLSAGSTPSDATLRLDNSTGGSITAGAVFGYSVK